MKGPCEQQDYPSCDTAEKVEEAHFERIVKSASQFNSKADDSGFLTILI